MPELLNTRMQSRPRLLNLGAEGKGGLDVTCFVLQIPVAAESSLSGSIGAGCHIRAGQLGQPRRRHHAPVSLDEVASVHEDVCVLAERLANDLELVCVLSEHGVEIENGVAEPELSFFAVGDDVD